jgi:hypothetical protein
MREKTNTAGRNLERGMGEMRNVNFWLQLQSQSRSLPARGRVDLEVHRCLCLIDSGNVFISM